MSQSNYARLFGADVAKGLGLAERPRVGTEEALRAYREDPAAAFSRVAALMQPPGDSVPIPFASVLTPANSTRE